MENRDVLIEGRKDSVIRKGMVVSSWIGLLNRALISSAVIERRGLMGGPGLPLNKI
jgi:hypothetical protein